jgi:hypothetical protein
MNKSTHWIRAISEFMNNLADTLQKEMAII